MTEAGFPEPLEMGMGNDPGSNAQDTKADSRLVRRKLDLLHGAIEGEPVPNRLIEAAFALQRAIDQKRQSG